MTNRNIIRVEGSDREFNRLKILFVLMLSLAMSLMAISSVNVTLPSLESGLGATDTDLQWVLSGYSLAFGISLIPAGRAGDVMGRSSWFVIGAGLFTVGSLLCGLAPNALILNLARVVQGLGAGIFSPQVTGMIQQYWHGGGRARAFAMFGLTISAAVAVGPVLAGGIVEAFGPVTGWRWTFFFYLPIGLLAVVLGLLWFPFDTERRRRRGSAAGRVDLDPIGTVLVVAVVLAIMYPFMARQPLAWGLLALAPVLLWLWLRWERRYAERGREPIVDLNLFSFTSFRNGLLVSSANFLGMTSTFAVVAIYLQSGLDVDALTVGLIGLPNAILSAFSSVYTVRFVMSHGRRLAKFALMLLVVGTVTSLAAGWAIGTLGWPVWVLSITLAFNGIGMGAFGSANQTLSMQDVPPEHGGTAGGIKQTTERIATALGNAAITSIFFLFVAGGTYVGGFVAAFSAIALCIMLAVGLAIMDERQHAGR